MRGNLSQVSPSSTHTHTRTTHTRTCARTRRLFSLSRPCSPLAGKTTEELRETFGASADIAAPVSALDVPGSPPPSPGHLGNGHGNHGGSHGNLPSWNGVGGASTRARLIKKLERKKEVGGGGQTLQDGGAQNLAALPSARASAECSGTAEGPVASIARTIRQQDLQHRRHPATMQQQQQHHLVTQRQQPPVVFENGPQQVPYLGDSDRLGGTAATNLLPAPSSAGLA